MLLCKAEPDQVRPIRLVGEKARSRNRRDSHILDEVPGHGRIACKGKRRDVAHYVVRALWNVALKADLLESPNQRISLRFVISPQLPVVLVRQLQSSNSRLLKWRGGTDC